MGFRQKTTDTNRFDILNSKFKNGLQTKIDRKLVKLLGKQFYVGFFYIFDRFVFQIQPKRFSEVSRR